MLASQSVVRWEGRGGVKRQLANLRESAPWWCGGKGASVSQLYQCGVLEAGPRNEMFERKSKASLQLKDLSGGYRDDYCPVTSWDLIGIPQRQKLAGDGKSGPRFGVFKYMLPLLSGLPGEVGWP